jgi:hypothetical protein
MFIIQPFPVILNVVKDLIFNVFLKRKQGDSSLMLRMTALGGFGILRTLI